LIAAQWPRKRKMHAASVFHAKSQRLVTGCSNAAPTGIYF